MKKTIITLLFISCLFITNIFTTTFAGIFVSELCAHEVTWQQEIYSGTAVVAGDTFTGIYYGGVENGINTADETTKPAFVDIDNDGDFDLFIGKGNGRMMFYCNDGNQFNPSWTLVTIQYESIDVGDKAAQTFVDIDNDEDFDLFIGASGGCLFFYRNDGTPENPSWTFVTTNYNSIITQGVPNFVDIDNDGDFDLFIGKEHTMDFYRNDGTPDSAYWAPVDTDYDSIYCIYGGGEVNPTFIDIDNDGDFDLFIGGLYNKLSFYHNNGTPNNPSWTFITNDYLPGMKPAFVDIDNDGDFDYFNGSCGGRITFYHNDGTPDTAIWILLSKYYNPIDIGTNSRLTLTDINNDGDFDLFITKRLSDGIHFYSNNGTPANPLWVFVTDNYDSLGGNWPIFVDIDNDGDFDYFSGYGTKLCFYRNDGTPDSASWTFISSYYGLIDVPGGEAKPSFVDIDNDGDFDLYIAQLSGGILYYRNDGTPDISLWTLVGYIGIGSYNCSAPFFVDIDQDGDFDMFIGAMGGMISFYRNDGTPESPSWSYITSNYNSIDVGYRAVPTFVDIDNDGTPDMFVGEDEGGINFWRNMGISNELPGSPLLSSPLNNSYTNNTTPQLTWEVPSDLDNDNLHFRVELSTTSDFATLVDTFESRFDTTGFSPTPPVSQGSGICSYILQSNLPEGSYWWRVSAYDGYDYGNTSSEWKFTIDTASPFTFNLISPLDSIFVNTTRPMFIWQSTSDSLSGLNNYKIYIDGSEKATIVDTSWTANYDLSETYHEWYIAAYDSAGNSRQSNSTGVFSIDITPPISEITFPPNGYIVQGDSLTVQGIANDAGIGIYKVFLSCDGGTNWDTVFVATEQFLGEVEWEHTYVLTPGPHTLVAKSIDWLGNEEIGGSSVSITVEYILPIADFMADITYGYVSLEVNFTDLSTQGTGTIVEWFWDFNNDGTIDSQAQNPQWTYYEIGNYTVTLTVYDGYLEDTEIKENHISLLNSSPYIQNSLIDFSFDEDTSDNSIDLFSVFDDPDLPYGDSLSFTYSGNDSILVEIVNGVVTLTPLPDWFGAENITFTAFDDSLVFISDDVLVTIINVNDPPTIVLPDYFTFAEDSTLVEDFTVYIDDIDPDELTLSVTGNTEITVDITGTIVTFGATANWNGTETLIFTVDDNQTRATASDSVDVIVTPVNDPPTIVLPDYFTFAEDSTLVEDFTVYIDDIDPDELTLSVTGNTEITVEIAGTIVTFGATENWNGTETLIFTVDDNQTRATASDSVDVIVTPVNDPPTIVLPDYFTFAEDSTLVEDFAVYIDDVDPDELTLSVTGNTEITVDIVGTIVTFGATENWNGTETLIFTVDDNQTRATASDSVDVIVTPVNDPPTIILPDDFTFAEDSTLVEDFAVYIDDVDPDELTLSVTGNTEITVDIVGTIVTFGATENWNGTETLIFTVDDNQTRATASDSVDVIVTPVNDPPVLIGFSPEELVFTVFQDSIVTFYVEVEDIDSDLIYAWFVDNDIQTEISDTFVYQFAELGEVEIKSEVSDEDYDIITIWDVTVIPQVGAEHLIPTVTELRNNYPNPFNPETTIEYSLKESGHMILEIYNTKGQRVITLVDAYKPAGSYSVNWDAKEMSSGIYFYKLSTKDKTLIKKMILLRDN